MQVETNNGKISIEIVKKLKLIKRGQIRSKDMAVIELNIYIKFSEMSIY